MENGKKLSVAEIVTQRLIADLEASIKSGTTPNWLKPWNVGRASLTVISEKSLINAHSVHAYRGMNRVLLSCVASTYKTAWFMTKSQGENLGIYIKSEEKHRGIPIVYWGQFKVKGEKINPDTGETEATEKNIPLLRYYTVWNIDQFDLKQGDMEKIPAYKKMIKQTPETIKANENKIPVNEAGEKIVAEYIENDGPNLTHTDEDRACYSPTIDVINCPHRKYFKTTESYYNTIFHEIIHSTGHEKRLKRDIKNYFGTQDYSKEELVAEIGATFLAAEAGIHTPAEHTNAVEYLKSWLRKLQNDPKMVLIAAGQAEKAANFVINAATKETVEVKQAA